MYSHEEIRQRNRSQTESESDPFTEDRYRQFARFLGPSWQVLDVGCNTGRGGAALKSVRPDVRLDGSEMLVERLQAVPPGIYRHLSSEPLADLAARHLSYDAVILGEVIEHVPYAELDGFVVQLLALVKRGGQIALTTPNPHSLVSRIKGRKVLGGAHVSVHCADALEELFRHHGASECRAIGSGKSSRYLGTHMPLPLYGSYMLLVTK